MSVPTRLPVIADQTIFEVQHALMDYPPLINCWALNNHFQHANFPRGQKYIWESLFEFQLAKNFR
jgi:hypothetical protein